MAQGLRQDLFVTCPGLCLISSWAADPSEGTLLVGGRSLVLTDLLLTLVLDLERKESAQTEEAVTQIVGLRSLLLGFIGLS